MNVDPFAVVCATADLDNARAVADELLAEHLRSLVIPATSTEAGRLGIALHVREQRRRGRRGRAA